MANREELALIRGARAGRPEAQLALGKRYLFGGAGLPKSLPTALHWLDRAAQQGCAVSCQLIGSHIPYDVAAQSPRPVAPWYEQAYDAGVGPAGMVLAQLVLGGHGGQAAPARRDKAMAALEAAAGAGVPDALWLLAQQRGGANCPANPAQLAAARHGGSARRPRAPDTVGAPLSLLDSTWKAGHTDAYLERALPMARVLVRALAAAPRSALRPSPDDVRMLSRCARALGALAADAPLQAALEAERQQFLELAAAENDRQAQLALGLWHAHMGLDGKRVAGGTGSANFKKAIRWLTLAGGQGLAEAWYALARIYVKPEFSQRNVQDAQRYLERAAEMGYRDAQLECGNSAWRARRENENNDVRAVYWLQKAAAQGCPQAHAALHKIAPRGQAAPGTSLPCPAVLADSHPLLAARLALAALFQLTRAEALLLDVKAADQGHCLVIDIRSSYGRSKRRLIAIDGPHERRALDQLARQFDGVDCGPSGPEGNYRQRLYRLKTLVPEAAGDLAERDDMLMTDPLAMAGAASAAMQARRA